MFSTYRNPKSIFLCLAVLLSLLMPRHAFSQIKTLYKYGHLSHIYYQQKKDSINENWLCPDLYKDKATQKQYREIWNNRKDRFSAEIEHRCFVYEKVVYNYLDGIIAQLVQANPKLIPVKPLVLIDRSSAVNANSMGGNILIVNLGLITFARTREDIAFVLAHELSHNILNHADNSLKQKAEWLASDEYKQSLKSVLDSKYGRYSRLVKVFEGYSFSRSRHSRYHESDADSLAIVLLKASKIPYDPTFFLRLDSADIQYRKPLKQPIKNYFTALNIPFDDWWIKKKSSGLSTRGYNFKDTTGIEDSLKTHPDCKQRYAATQHLADNTTQTPIPAAVYERATRMLIWNLYDDNMLTTCLYRILMEKDNGNTDVWYDFMIHNVFAGLVYADNQLKRFNAVGVLPKEYISESYYALQNMLEQMPRENVKQYYEAMRNSSFWTQMDKDATDFKELEYTLATETDSKQALKAMRDFSDNHPASMYNELTDHFIKK